MVRWFFSQHHKLFVNMGTCIGVEVQIINNAAIITTFPFKLEVQKKFSR